MSKKQIPLGNTFVQIWIDGWTKHDRMRYEIRILCVDNPYSSYDGLRDRIPTLDDLKTAVDWIINNERQHNLAGFTESQLIELQKEIRNRLTA